MEKPQSSTNKKKKETVKNPSKPVSGKSNVSKKPGTAGPVSNVYKKPGTPGPVSTVYKKPGTAGPVSNVYKKPGTAGPVFGGTEGPVFGIKLPKLMFIPKTKMVINHPEKLPLPYWYKPPPPKDLSKPKVLLAPRPLTPLKVYRSRYPLARQKLPTQSRVYPMFKASPKQTALEKEIARDKQEQSDFFELLNSKVLLMPEKDLQFDPLNSSAHSPVSEPEAVSTCKPSVRRKLGAKPKQTCEPVYSEIDLSQYEDTFKEVYEEDFGSSGPHHMPLPLPAKKVEFVRSNHHFRTRVSFDPPEAYIFPIHHMSSQDLDIRSEFLPRELQEDLSNEKSRKLKKTETELPPWINRQEWNEKKWFREQRHKEQEQEQEQNKNKPCIQLFPGRCFDEKERNLKSLELNARFRAENKSEHQGHLFRQTEEEKHREEDMERRQLVYKRMWEQLDVMKPERTHRYIPYRQGSTVVLGFPGHGSTVENEDVGPREELTEYEADVRRLKLEYYKRMASLYIMEESDKKDKQRNRLMAATKCLLDICPSLLGDPHQPRPPLPKTSQFNIDNGISQTDSPNPWLPIEDKKSTMKRFGYNTTLKNSTLKKKLPSKENKPLGLKTFREILAEPDDQATFFKLCPTCRKYVKTSDLSTHETECCVPKKEPPKLPTQFDYFNGSVTKSYHINIKPPNSGPGTFKSKRNR